MAKKGTASTPPKPKKGAAEPDAVTIEYDLFELPTAQHKAGLAGLLLQIDSMKGDKPTVEWVKESPRTRVRVTFTKDTTQRLFDAAYAASVDEEWFPQKKPKEQLKNERTREVRGNNIKEFAYDTTRPTFPALQQLLGSGASGAAWLKLWQAMAWGVPRGVHTTRRPFEVVAGWDRDRSKEARQVAGRPCPEGADAWRDLVACHSVTDRRAVPVAKVEGKLWLGVQDKTAERIGFEGRIDHTLLLHFWQNAVLIYVPQTFKPVRKAGKLEAKRRYDGFALAVPEVTNLPRFLSRFRLTLASMGREPPRETRWPVSSVVELAAQGGLSLAARDQAAGIAIDQATQTEVEYSISGVDYLHFRPGKNGPRMLGAGRLALVRDLAKKYWGIVGRAGERPPYANPLFRRGLLLALLNEQPWYKPFGKLFAEWDVSFFVPTDAPPNLSWFWADARKYLHFVEGRVKSAPSDAPPDEDDILASTVNKFVQRYLDERIRKDRPEWDFPKFRKEKKTPPEAAEARRKLAERLFLELRSRRDQAFVDHFTNTFFAVPQFFGHKPAPKMFERIAGKLLNDASTVKTLTLMALSSNGWIPTPKPETPK